MTESCLLIENKKYLVKYPTLLNQFLDANAEKRIIEEKEFSKLAETLLPLIPIGVAIAGGALVTWVISREQKAIILKEYC